MLISGKPKNYVRKFMQVLGMLGSTVFLILIAYAETLTLAAVFTCLALAFLAFCYSGADTAMMEIAPRYSGSVTGFVGTIGNIPGFVAVGLIGWLVDTTGSYASGFMLAAGVNIMGMLVWIKWGTAEKVID